jgi:hypothetical protein
VESEAILYVFDRFCNENNKTVSFKIYDAKDVVKVQTKLSFKINEHYGTLFRPIVFCKPALVKEYRC